MIGTGILNAVRLSGALQGIILAIVIFNKRKLRANRFLGSFLLLFAVHLGILTFYNQKTMLSAPHLILLFDFLPFLYGPLVYHYFFHLLFRDYKPAIPFAFQLIPALLDILSYGAIFLISASDFVSKTIIAVFSGNPPWFVMLIDGMKFLSGIAYILLTLRLFLKHRHLIRSWTSASNHSRWLWTMILGFTACWIPALAAAVAQYFSGDLNPAILRIYQTVQSICFTVFFYIVALFAWRFPSILSPKTVREEIRKKLNLTEEQIRRLRQKLDTALQEGLYLDPELSLKTAAEDLETHANILSFIVNEHYGQNFKELINRFRIDEFKRLCGSGRLEQETVLSLALDAGFNSKSSFNRIFKDLSGETPSEFLKNIKK